MNAQYCLTTRRHCPTLFSLLLGLLTLAMAPFSPFALSSAFGQDSVSQEIASPAATPDAAGAEQGEPEMGSLNAIDKPASDSSEGEGDSAPQNLESEDLESEDRPPPLVTNDAVVFGMLMLILGFVFWSSNSQWSAFKLFYRFVPMLLMCYFLPSLLTLGNVVNAEESQLYFVASRYLLPASLVLLTLSVDLKAIFGLGPKALIMFLTGTVGVVLGGPFAILVVGFFFPDVVGGEGDWAVWRGLSTVAGSWIGGGANQTAMKEIFTPHEDLFSVMVTIDVLVAEFWMMFLLLGVGKADRIDAAFKADASSIERLKEKMESYQAANARNPSTTDLFVMLGTAFGVTGIAHFIADLIAPWMGSLNEIYPVLSWMSLNKEFFWLIVIATTVGVVISFTSLRELEGAGASKLGTVFIFILVATIGLQMDLRAVVNHASLFVVGGIWMLFHVGLLFTVGWLIRAPYFFLAVGSKANIGGAASAPVVATAFHPALAPVGVLLAVLGYVLGTFGAWLCGLMMQFVAPT